MTVRILAVQPSEIDPPQRLGDWFAGAGAQLEIVRPFEERLPDDLEEVDGLVVLGGEMGAHDDVQHPWLRDVRALLSAAVSGRTPTLGICLGAQLLAAATGGQVRAGSKGPEVGTVLVAKRDVAWEDPLLESLPLTPDVLQFHGDEVFKLPPTGTLLASSPKYEHQAFRVGDCAYGFQFHIETTTETVLSWAANRPEMSSYAREGHLEEDHLEQFHELLEDTWRPVAERFVEWAGLPPDERPGRRQLPVV